MTDQRLLDMCIDPNHVIVGVGESAVGSHPEILVTMALGSCVGVCLWDARTRIGGMAHIMLPSAPAAGFTGRPHRFASIAVPELVEQMVARGANRRSMVAKIAGGSAMFKGDSGIDSIGGRNVAAVKSQLAANGINVVSADTGGSHARTIELHLDTGSLHVRSYTFGIREI